MAEVDYNEMWLGSDSMGFISYLVAHADHLLKAYEYNLTVESALDFKIMSGSSSATFLRSLLVSCLFSVQHRCGRLTKRINGT